MNLDKKEYDDDGNLEYSSPKGTIEILAPQARDRFPSTLMADINGRYICKVWSYDTDNPETLYGQALAQLKKNCIPQVSYTVDGYIDAEIGDTFIIEDSEYAPTLYLEARITEQSISFTNRDNCKTTFDNFEELQSQINESLIDEMKLLINANKMYDASIITSNGSVFKNDTDSTVLTALIRENGVDITESLTVFWYKNGNKILEQKSVSVIATDFIEKAVYKFEAFKDEQIKATCEITIINVRDGKDGPKGDDAITLYIESSNGNTFKNSDIATILTVYIYIGAERIESAEQLEKRFGKSAYLQWSVKKLGEKEFSPIELDDSRLNDKGFIFTISPRDINKKAVFNCELNLEE